MPEFRRFEIYYSNMKNLSIIIAGLAVMILAACSKDKFKTEPQIKIKSVKPSAANKGDVITFISSFTDDEGDVQDSVLIVFKRFNGNTPLSTDTFRYKMPGGIPETRQGEIIIHFGYGEFIDGTIFLNLESVDREAAFGLIISDNAGHRSNYAESDRITLKKL
jgi:hypothetical protein